jgi:hypothetical protein
MPQSASGNGREKMDRSLETRINESFPSDDKESIRYYLDAVMASLKAHAEKARHSTSVMLVFMAAFELLLRGTVKQATFGPFVLSGFTTIEAFVPLAVTYFYYETLLAIKDYEHLSSVYCYVFGLWNPVGDENDLDVYVQPPVPLYVPRTMIGQSDLPGADIAKKTHNATALLLTFLPLFFIGYAFYQLFHLLHPSSLLLWINVAISTLVLLLLNRQLSAAPGAAYYKWPDNPPKTKAGTGYHSRTTDDGR